MAGIVDSQNLEMLGDTMWKVLSSSLSKHNKKIQQFAAMVLPQFWCIFGYKNCALLHADDNQNSIFKSVSTHVKQFAITVIWVKWTINFDYM